MSEGKFITIYGINNIGKSTQARLLVEKLNADGRKAVYVKYPVYDLAPTGPFLNKILRGKGGQSISEDELQLWFILNRYQLEPQLKKWLNEGYIVVAEDYTGTGIAWGVAKGLDKKWLIEANIYLLKEDFAIMLEGGRHMEAREKQHLHEESDVLVERCRLVHESLAVEFGWNKIKVQEKIEDTAEELWKKVIEFLGASRS